jgi:CRP/FNR family transcriptional regulator, cyclic AMP receptor protein
MTDLPRPMNLRQRARAPHAEELEAIPWLRVLSGAEHRTATAALQVVDAGVGEFVCKIGRPANYWFGVVDGLLKMSNDSTVGPSITFIGVPPGVWFGEGTLLKREAYRYNIEPLRRSVVAGLPIDTFNALLDSSIAFNRYLMHQLNERLGQFIGALETDRMNDPDSRVARSLAALFQPGLAPGRGNTLRITQQELAYLVGLSRQRTNEALKVLQAQGLIRVNYGGVEVLDVGGLTGRRAP